MKDPPNAFDAGCAFEHVFKRASVASSAREPQRSPPPAPAAAGREGKLCLELAGPGTEQHQAKPGVDLGKRSGNAWALRPVPLHRLPARQALRAADRLSAPPRGLASGGNLGGAEHAVRNNSGGGIFFLLGSVKSLIYGFLSGPGLQIIPLSKQPNS